MEARQADLLVRLLEPRQLAGTVEGADASEDGYERSVIALALRVVRRTRLRGPDAFRGLVLVLRGMERGLPPQEALVGAIPGDELVEWTGRAVLFTTFMALEDVGAVDGEVREDAAWALAQVGAMTDGLATVNDHGVRDGFAIEPLMALIDAVILRLWGRDALPPS